jgi:hypothetical protein
MEGRRKRRKCARYVNDFLKNNNLKIEKTEQI